jgi:hypothetical protein
MDKWLAIASVLAACGTAHGDPKPDYEAHIQALRAKLRAHKLERLAIRIEDPFVVVGDKATLERSTQTVRWAADHLEKDFFAKRPTKILDIYLFGDADSYEDGVKTLTGSSPTTPYGFYSSTNEGMFMNIATGGGTLVHEIVHPYVEADFPNAPPWLNEGLGSLFEQSNEKDGHIIGMTNWRLAGLQKTIKKGGLQSFKDLAHLSTEDFYGDKSGTNYAQARYLLYYLQESGKLRTFYATFRTNRSKDPSGYQTLVASIGAADMDAFQKKWETWVLALRFP